ncbi:putative C6 transcription factor [Aspergillus japonicus CBS 114.51]|uniref:Putative C6 transcription factor n=1 Tax=Aspergillus japonicus CBS 114.51 TaxID=1448312 RepID=A0A8T8XE60_ASPJA|nr:putative C6 transcription factor [Aspergillus japonicus CBS 114.51]RAH85612.1 putative C6 transcription factor [Aspergillus japonicus CBS 114.51]
MVRPAPLACTECRKQHLKCDAKTPSCSRCLENRFNCLYLPSRRGGRRKTRDATQQQPLATTPSYPRLLQQQPMTSHLATPSTIIPHHASSVNMTEVSPSSSGQQELPIQLAEGIQDPTESDARLVRLYYENFHSAHPILVPAPLYEERKYPKYLHEVVVLIGSHFLPQSSASLSESTLAELSASGERTPCKVQALLLYSILLCAREECPQAQTMFSTAVDIALELGMYRRDFATTSCDERDVEAESLRRTWWELFTVDVYMAALQKKVVLRCSSVPYDVALPCEESAYANHSNIPPPPTLAGFNKRIFTADDDDDGEADQSRYSSFSYRIEAVCILARVIVLNSLPETHRDHLQAVENALVSWTNHLPSTKVDIVDMYGSIDEMLFQAHTTIHYAAMLLHLPRSNLRPALPDTGVPISPVIPSRLSPSFTRHVHDIKATEASKQLSNLLSVRPSVQRYSPFVVFGLVLCGMVQLATSRIHPPECSDHHCNRIILVLGCLKTLKNKWSVANRAHHYLRNAASETFTAWIESRYPQASGSAPPASRNDASSNSSTIDSSAWIVAPGIPGALRSADADVQGLFSPGLLSAYIDPTCSEPLLLHTMPDLDFT